MKRATWLHITMAFFIAVTGLVACGDDDNGPTGTGNDTTPPSVQSVAANDGTHITVRFTETVERVSAEDEGNYTITGGGGPVDVVNASLKSDLRTVVLTTTAMTTGSLLLTVDDVEDTRGNVIGEAVEKTFNGSTAADNTPPEIVVRAPSAGATNVSRTDPIVMTFSEPVSLASFTSGFALVNNGNPVAVTINTEDDVHFSIQPDVQLAGNQTFAVQLIGVADANANVMNDTQWTFKTTATGGNDTTPPTLVSTTPANNATGVATSSTISMTFSEAIESSSFVPVIDPAIGDPTPVWSNGGKTVTFTPVVALAANQQYSVTLAPGTVSDTSGNTNTSTISLSFTTGGGI